MGWIEIIKTWFSSNELYRYRLLQVIQKKYFIKHQVEINKQYSNELLKECNIRSQPFKSEDTWTYIPRGSQYEN